MVASKSSTYRAAERLTHGEASRLADLALKGGAQTIVLDLGHVREATTAAFARLVLLRRDLLKHARDVRLAGLRGRPAQLFEVHRLQTVLPRISEIPVAQPAAVSRKKSEDPRLDYSDFSSCCILR